MIAIVALVLAQGPTPELKASVDRDRVTVGDEIVFTVRAVSRSTAPMQLELPAHGGFEMVARSERTEVSQLGGPSRTTTLELTLRALKAGRWQLGPARATQGGATVFAAPIAVQVDEQPGALLVAGNPVLRQLIARAPPPRTAGQPAVSLVLSARTAAVGEQVDVVTAAWFPRELRARLRRPPTLQPPVMEGVWSYPQPTPPGIAATRRVDGVLYDLFVAHHVVFPLVPGRVTVAPAVLKYSVPVALQFFSHEERFTLTSSAETLLVAAPPVDGRPTTFRGAVGEGLTLERTIEPATVRVGEPVTVAFALTGWGNPALWPAPEIRWPPGVRAYADRTDEQSRVRDGRLEGTKTFRFTVVPDSTGTVVLPGASYVYYDLGARAFRSAAIGDDALAVAVGTEARPARPLPPPLLPAGPPPLSWRLVAGAPAWLWWLIALVPPGAFVIRRRRVWWRRGGRAAAAGADRRSAEAELEAVIRGYVPAPEALGTAALVAALRSAGVEASTAQRLVALREQLRELRYGPAARDVPPELAREVRALVGRVGLPGGRVRALRIAGTLAVLLAVPTAQAQAPSPEALYERGALRGAVEGFARRTAAEPAVPAHWYNLGASYYRLALDGRAAAAWLQARRLAPRARTIRRALDLVPPPETESAARLWQPPVTWQELVLIAGPLWCVGWVLLARRRRRDLAVGLIVAALAFGAGAGLLYRWQARPIAIVLGPTPLQLSPHERAPTLTRLEPGSAVLVVRRQPGWVMVSAPDRRLGWLPAEALFALRRV